MQEYRKYKKGDTVRITGFQGRLFGSTGERKFAEGVSLGVECVLIGGEDDDFDVKLPEGILLYDKQHISVACIKLVEAVEDKPVGKKPATIEHKEYYSVFLVNSGDDNQWLAKLWYDGGVPKEVAEACANIIKAAYDTAH